MQPVGLCSGGLNGPTSVPLPVGRAGRWSCRSGHVAVWWPVTYGSCLGDPCVLGGSGLWPVVGRGIEGSPGCRTTVVWRAAKIWLKRAACAARACSSLWMAGDTCPASNVRIWWMAKRGHKLSVVSGFAR